MSRIVANTFSAQLCGVLRHHPEYADYSVRLCLTQSFAIIAFLVYYVDRHTHVKRSNVSNQRSSLLSIECFQFDIGADQPCRVFSGMQPISGRMSIFTGKLPQTTHRGRPVILAHSMGVGLERMIDNLLHQATTVASGINHRTLNSAA